MSIPDTKLEEIRNECSEWSNKKEYSKRDLQSLLGKLLYVTKCVRVSRFLLNRILHTLMQAHKNENFHTHSIVQHSLNVNNFKVTSSWMLLCKAWGPSVVTIYMPSQSLEVMKLQHNAS